MNSTILSKEKDKERFEEVRRRAIELGVRDMNFNGAEKADTLECYEQTLDLIEQHKAFFDQYMSEQ
ncbi:MAG: hypothetical protein LBL76_10025 [Treponema sp.]|nr:hypothetical protein [Treponema sp.]